MFIAHKSNVIQNVAELDWQCRRLVKGMSKPEYWAWLASVTDADGVVDYSGETGYTIVECTDEDVNARLLQLDDYISNKPGEKIYNIKYYASKRDSEILIAENVEDEEGNSVAKVYLQSHFVGDDSAKDARLLADKWDNIRSKRNRKLAETDYLALSDNTLATNMKTYRQELRDVPKQSDPDNITWPTKP